MKRKRNSKESATADKRARVGNASHIIDGMNASLLRRYYTNVCTLRQYLLCRIPKSSRARRRKIHRHGLDVADIDAMLKAEIDLLDTTLIGSHKFVPLADLENIDNDISLYTQQTGTALSGSTPRSLYQAEVIEYCLSRLGNRGPESRVTNLLCHANILPDQHYDPQYQRVMRLKQHPWTALPNLIGSASNRILVEMFCDCGIFVSFKDTSNMFQVSGQPVSDLKVVTRQDVQANTEDQGSKPISSTRLSDVRIERHRMLYGRPDRKESGSIDWRLQKHHILNQLHTSSARLADVRLARYIFPHQFRLRSIFSVNSTRATETQSLQQEWDRAAMAVCSSHLAVPKRMRSIMKIVSRIRIRHKRAAFSQLLEYYCPRPMQHPDRSISLATPEHQVSAFCQAAILKVFGRACFGSLHNLSVIKSKTDHFVKLRRHELMCLHEVFEGIKVKDIAWLGFITTTTPLSKTDFEKRKQILAEFLYFVFNSFLIALIKGHFHVTESSGHRHRLFYFRHDVWQALCSPALKELKSSMLEELDERSLAILNNRKTIGVNFVRMVPKERGMRPIINLRRRVTKQQHGKTVLGMSINSILQSAFQAMNYEKQHRPELVGTSMFSVADMLPQLQTYRDRLKQLGLFGKPLYFVKVDVKGCFDSIPQHKVMEIIDMVLTRRQYAVKKYSRGKLLRGRGQLDAAFGARPSWKYAVQACERDGNIALEDIIAEQTAAGRNDFMFIDGRRQNPQSRNQIMLTLHDHIRTNLVKIGKTTYRQAVGIAQGSIVSSLLCNLLYTQMQHDVLSFTAREDTTLLRLIDDFLLITPCRETAEQFVQIMHNGIPEYGVQIKSEKSWINFTTSNGITANITAPIVDFPYCGHTINTATLDIGKDIERAKRSFLADTVTVEHGRLQGQNFHFKTLNNLRMQMKDTLMSTAYNSVETVLVNLSHIFSSTIEKSYHYIRALPTHKQPSSELLIRTMADTITQACSMIRRQCKSDVAAGDISTAHVTWLACTAYSNFLQPRQTKYRDLLAWLHNQLSSSELIRVERQLLQITGNMTR